MRIVAIVCAWCWHWRPAANPRVRWTPPAGAYCLRKPFRHPRRSFDEPRPEVGAIFLGGFDLHTCTGCVVHSSSGDLILTAAHCMAKQFKAVFVPGFAHTAAPTNVWHIDAVYLDPL